MKRKRGKGGRPRIGRTPTVKIGFSAPKDVVKAFRLEAKIRQVGLSELFREVFESWQRR